MNIFQFLQNSSEALATLLAVILGFFLSFFTNKAAWGQRKKEQIREHQIDSLKTLVHIMQRIDFIVKTIVIIKKRVLMDKTKYSGSGSTNINRITSGNSKISQYLDEIERLKVEYIKELWELKFLKYNKKQIKLIENYITQLDKLILEYRSCKNFVENELINDTRNDLVIAAFQQFIDEGENGLTK